MISTTFTASIAGHTDLGNQSAFAIASALTRLGQEVKTAQVKATDDAFTIRNRWNVQGPLAFKVQKAEKKDYPNSFAVVGTAAEFLEKFIREPAGSIVIKTPRGEFLAIPTTNVRRTKRDIIRAMQRPRALRDKGASVVLPTRSGGLALFELRGRGKQRKLVRLYNLVKRAKIKEVDIVAGPAEKVVTKRFGPILTEQHAKALATAR